MYRPAPYTLYLPNSCAWSFLSGAFTSVLVQSTHRPLVVRLRESLAYIWAQFARIQGCKFNTSMFASSVIRLRVFQRCAYVRTLRPHKGMTCQPTSLWFRWCYCARRRRSALRPLCDRGILENRLICYILQFGTILA